ncbi:MAG: acetyl-CoA carboxylase biotin carboxylase subunit [Oligoflexales bacterium]
MKKIMIANRGEIAVRIIRACQEMGYRTVAVYSSADRDSLHTKIADESICIGPGPSINSYLSIPSLMSAAEIAGVDGIHPGYGFLAENDQFAEVCNNYGITFIGPSVEQIRKLGNKVQARAIAKQADVPMLPGSDGVVKDIEEARHIAEVIGYPLIIKAAAGGGGRGMKLVFKPEDLERQFLLARSEAEVSFGSSDVFIERYCQKPRHVEVQILGDQHGNLIHLGERDCSIQRRNQKLVEESPSPVVTPEIRERIGATALRLAKEVGYYSAGTVEFLMDENKEFYFMEVNTRIQVEHPVTECVTGVDLIKEQLKVAEGKKISYSQKDIQIRGHAIECRINAEDPVTFAPWPGNITAFHLPGGPGVRVDTMVYAGYKVPSLYDSMIGKLITYGSDRKEALIRMRRCLSEMKVDGIRTNIPFHIKLMANKQFESGDISTRFLETFDHS